MDTREASRLGTAGGPAARRFARLVAAPSVRRLAPSRLALALLGMSAGFVVLALIFSNGLRSARHWLHGRPEYQARFSAIELDPAPPAWFAGGAAGFLERAREVVAPHRESFSVLDVPAQDLKRGFGLYCWVERVNRIAASHPNRLRVQLEYRTPVAVPYGFPGVVLDRHGVVLPAKDVEPAYLERLIPIKIPKPTQENAPPPGEVWKRVVEPGGRPRVDEGVVRAAALADFVLDARRTETGVPVKCISIDGNRLWLMCTPEVWVRWCESAENGKSGRSEDSAKWAMLREWFQTRGARQVVDPDYLEVSKDGVVLKHGKR
jgi:hypothetical protein